MTCARLSAWPRPDNTTAEPPFPRGARGCKPWPWRGGVVAADDDPRRGQNRSPSPSPHGRTRMIVFPLIRSVGLKAATASSRAATLPMFVRTRPSRARRTISLSWARSGTTTKSTVRPSAGRASVGPVIVTSVPPARITPQTASRCRRRGHRKPDRLRRHLPERRYRGRRTPARRSREPSDGRQRARRR